jgi:hypothetical protein
MGHERILLRHSPAGFLWWRLTVSTTFALYLWLFEKDAKVAQAGFDKLAMGNYPVTALGIVIASLLIGANNLAMIGLFAMIPWVAASWLSLAKN